MAITDKDETKEVCPVLSIAASVSKKNMGSYCLREQCAWWNKPCKCCCVKLI